MSVICVVTSSLSLRWFPSFFLNPNPTPNHRSNLDHNTLTVASSGSDSVRRRNPKSTSSSSPSASSKIAYRKESKGFVFGHHKFFIAMAALGFIAMALFLFFNFDLQHGSFTSASAVSSTEVVEITYGTVLKLMHQKTGFRLHSHEVAYGTGSGQQSVTGFPNVDDSNSYWIVRPVLDESVKQGVSIKTGTVLRLQHMKTRRWLHSHLHASPISGNMEVSCFGGENESDTGDYWRLLIEGNEQTWKKDQKVRFQHVDTGGYLHSHDKKYSRAAGGQQEVCGVKEKRADNIWLAAEGIYLPITESIGSS